MSQGLIWELANTSQGKGCNTQVVDSTKDNAELTMPRWTSVNTIVSIRGTGMQTQPWQKGMADLRHQSTWHVVHVGQKSRRGRICVIPLIKRLYEAIDMGREVV